jgi:hypothetical protein
MMMMQQQYNDSLKKQGDVTATNEEETRFSLGAELIPKKSSIIKLHEVRTSLDDNLLDEVLGSKDYEKLLSADVFDEAAEIKV